MKIVAIRPLKIWLRAALLLISGAAILASAFSAFGFDRHQPAQFAAYSKPLKGDDKLRHALDRLTFGPRPGDLAVLKAQGLKGWLKDQLQPGKLKENPVLQERLAPLETVRLDASQTNRLYPPLRLIRAVASGKQPLPEDPQQRRMLQDFVAHCLDCGEKNGAEPSSIRNASLASMLNQQQIQTIQSGKPDEKHSLLVSIPGEKYTDFVWALRPNQRRALLPFAPVELRRQLMFSINPQQVVASDLIESKILRAVYSTHQLQELLVDFWFNHFNVFIDKGADHYLVATFERDALRPHVFGKFYDLLLATAQSPAMLFYLDNWQSTAPRAQVSLNGRPHRGLNENYGRELLELHTLGVDGGYTQQDVIEVARCFTGWTIANPRKGGTFSYNDKMHDKGRKSVLGVVIPAGGGMNDGLQVLKLLARQPATAHFISLQLARRFVADDPPPSLVSRMSAAFLSKDGDLRAVMRTMLNSPEFWSQGAYQAKIKTPFETVVSAVRAAAADLDSALPLGNEIAKLGEPLYRKIEPTGYSSANAEWVSSASLLARMNFAIALAQNRVPGSHVNTAGWVAEMQTGPMGIARTLLAGGPSPATRAAIENALNNPELQQRLTGNAKATAPLLPSLIAGLTLGSPEFQKR